MVLSAYAIPGIKDVDRKKINSIEGKIERIIDKVCSFYCVRREQVMGKTRKRPIVIARQFCMYFLRMNLQLHLKHIGDIMGGKDHTTVIHAMAAIRDQLSIKIDTEIKSDYHKLVQII